MGCFIIWPNDLITNLNGMGGIENNWKFDILNWEFLNFDKRLQK
jgi:hypothetical protein